MLLFSIKKKSKHYRVLSLYDRQLHCAGLVTSGGFSIAASPKG
jgi:hypothetical protein